MKKYARILTCIMVFSLFIPQTALANMAEPQTSSIASTITFEKSDQISVLSEVLDITVTGATADITARYEMKNTTDSPVSTQTMFLSPNIEQSEAQVLSDEIKLPVSIQSYALTHTSEIATDDWAYVILDNEPTTSDSETVDAITFVLDFDSNEQKEIVVTYTYALGGYPEYEYNVKCGEIEYYLTPAAMWKDFENLTINLYLDSDMPIIKASNLEFEKIDTCIYQYVSDTLPEENLSITIDENWYQNIFSTMNNPYFAVILTVLSPVIPVLMLIIAIFFGTRIKNKKEKNNKSDKK